MTLASALLAYLIIYTGIAFACEKCSPLVAIGGLILAVSLLKLI